MNVEEVFIDSFVIPERRERMKELLAKSKNRAKVTRTLAHFRSFEPVWVKPVIGTQDPHRTLLLKGAPPTCHAISEDHRLDGRAISLAEALQAIVGHGMGTILICIPNHLAYCEGEGPSDRCILERPAI